MKESSKISGKIRKQVPKTSGKLKIFRVHGSSENIREVWRAEK